jgi:hypothetical protein
VPSLLNPSISAQVCVISSNRKDIRDTTPSTQAPPHIIVPPVGALLPQEFPENTTTPLVQDSPPLRGTSQFGRQTPKPLPKSHFSTPHLESKHSRMWLPSPFLTWFSPSLYGISTHPLWFLHHLSLLRQRDYQCKF